MLDIEARLQTILRLIENFVMLHAQIPLGMNCQGALILGRMVRDGTPITAGDLRKRGMYAGTNSTYNLSQLVEKNYVSVERPSENLRISQLMLTPAGEEVGLRVVTILAYLEENFGELAKKSEFEKAKTFFEAVMTQPIPLKNFATKKKSARSA
jgi:DNA-binding MarR family transcriptional regulator